MANRWLHTCSCGSEFETSSDHPPERCDCGKVKCEECIRRCEVCGYEGCQECMTYQEGLDAWLCGERDCLEEMTRQVAAKGVIHESAAI